LILPLLNESVARVARLGSLPMPICWMPASSSDRVSRRSAVGRSRHIRAVGADNLVARLQALQAKYGERFAPRPGWDSGALRG
jgi:hypothetical protein